MKLNRFEVLAMAAGLAVLGATGCATKNYVRTQTAPLVEHADQLDAKTAANNQQIQAVDERAQSGIKQAQSAADAANQNAQGATKAAGDAQVAAVDAVHRADSLDSVVKGLDSYKSVANVTVTFGFNKSTLDKDAIAQLDELPRSLERQRATSWKSLEEQTRSVLRNTTTI